jgi:hypothetical protein
VVKDAPASLDAEFEVLYTDVGRPSIPSERLQMLFSVRSERQLMELGTAVAKPRAAIRRPAR